MIKIILNKYYFILYLTEQDGICSTDILVLRCYNSNLNKFYAYYMRTNQFNTEVCNTVSGQQLPRTSWNSIETIKVPIPRPQQQQSIIFEIEKCEAKIKEAQAIINGIAKRKEAVIYQYL